MATPTKRLKAASGMGLSTHSDLPTKHPRRKQVSKTIEEEYPSLTASQVLVIQSARKGLSFFYTGAAGTGKSYVLSVMVDDLKKINGVKGVYVTASTGIAASSIGGVTLHSYLGLGLCDGSAIEMIAKMISSKMPGIAKAKKRIIATKTLVIDECSMVSAEFLDKIDKIARAVRNCFDKPFGGIQLILCGDFFQLPPVVKGGKSSETTLLFETEVWKQTIGDRIVILDQIMRQKNPELILLLTDLRYGRLSDRSRALIESRRVESHMNEDDVVKLVPTKNEAEHINKLNLELLDASTQRKFPAVDRGDQYQVDKLKDSWMAPSELVLREGAMVMFIYNIAFERGIVNGSTGKIIGFEFPSGFPIVELPNGVTQIAEPKTWEVKCGNAVIASRTQVPLILAYAITIHKSQGMTIPRLEINMDNIFEYGQTYVAFSRASTLEGLYVRGKIPVQSLLEPNPKVVSWRIKLP